MIFYKSSGLNIHQNWYMDTIILILEKCSLFQNNCSKSFTTVETMYLSVRENTCMCIYTVLHVPKNND